MHVNVYSLDSDGRFIGRSRMEVDPRTGEIAASDKYTQTAPPAGATRFDRKAGKWLDENGAPLEPVTPVPAATEPEGGETAAQVGQPGAEAAKVEAKDADPVKVDETEKLSEGQKDAAPKRISRSSGKK